MQLRTREILNESEKRLLFLGCWVYSPWFARSAISFLNMLVEVLEVSNMLYKCGHQNIFTVPPRFLKARSQVRPAPTKWDEVMPILQIFEGQQ